MSLPLSVHIPAHGIRAIGAGNGDGVGHAGTAFGNAGIGVGVAEIEGASTGFVPARNVGVTAGGGFGLKVDAGGDFDTWVRPNR